MEPITAASVYSEIPMPALRLNMAIMLLLLVLPASAILGFALGQRQHLRTRAAGKEIDRATGETSLGAVLGILGLLLAFSFGNALSLAQTRKLVVIDEAAALGTAFLRADLLPEPGRTDLKSLIYSYTQTRVLPMDAQFGDARSVRAFLDTTLLAQAELWPATLAATADPVPANIRTFVADSVNSVIDSHLYRMQTFSVPVSELTHLMVLVAAVISLFLLGNRAGTLGRKLSWRTFLLSGSLFVVMVTVMDVQRAMDGTVRIDQTPLLATLFDMEQEMTR